MISPNAPLEHHADITLDGPASLGRDAAMILRRMLVALAVVAAVCAGVNGCKKDEPKSTRWDDAAAAVTTVQVSPSGAPAAPAIQAGVLPKYFPKDESLAGYKRVHSADKEGYAEAKLQKDGKEVAILSIADAEKLAYAKAKFDTAADKLDGYPLMTVGNNQTSVLVKGRFQVKVSSQTLDNDARKGILSKFDLKGLEGT